MQQQVKNYTMMMNGSEEAAGWQRWVASLVRITLGVLMAALMGSLVSQKARASLPLPYEISFEEACQDGQGSPSVSHDGRQQVVHCHMDFTGHDLAAVPSLRPEGCFDLCRNAEGCHAFTWSDFEGGVCWLKKQASTLAAATGLYSAEVQLVATPQGQPAPFCSGSMPILTVSVASKPSAETIEVRGFARLSDRSKYNCYGVHTAGDKRWPIAIKKRGSSSFYAYKSAFALELYNDATYTNKRARRLLGMQPSAEWVLKGNPYDRIQIKDLFAGDLARATGAWAPHGKLVHLFWQVQGQGAEYAGLYLLMEKIERAPERLALAKNGGGGDISGSYIWQYNSCIRPGCAAELLPGMRDIRLEYPRARKATPAQKAYLVTTIRAYWDFLRGPRQDLESMLNVDSFAAYFLHTELSQNVDAYWRSTWFHKKPRRDGGQIYAGPVWDLDLAYGQIWDWPHNRAGWQGVEGWRFREDWRWFNWAHGHGGDVNEYAALLRRPVFKQRLTELWENLRATSWSDEALRQGLQAYRQELLSTTLGSHPSAAQHEAFRWPSHFANASELVRDFVSIERWLIKRAQWMDAHLGDL